MAAAAMNPLGSQPYQRVAFGAPRRSPLTPGNSCEGVGIGSGGESAGHFESISEAAGRVPIAERDAPPRATPRRALPPLLLVRP